MLKHELIRQTSAEVGHPHSVVRDVLDAAARVVRSAVTRGDAVMLFGLGRLYTVQRGEKRARNIRTGETVIVPPRRAVLLQASDSLVEAANVKS